MAHHGRSEGDVEGERPCGPLRVQVFLHVKGTGEPVPFLLSPLGLEIGENKEDVPAHHRYNFQEYLYE